MSSKNRWAYMKAPRYNPPNDTCPHCSEKSKTYIVGSKRTETGSQSRYVCEHQHQWIIYHASSISRDD